MMLGSSRRMHRRTAPAALVGITALSLLLCAPAAHADAPEAAIETMDRAALEAALARDQARLEELLTRVSDPDAPPLHEDPELARIARRMPALQRALREADRRSTRPAAGATGGDRAADAATGDSAWEPSIELPTRPGEVD
jgi:hypothetical protein